NVDGLSVLLAAVAMIGIDKDLGPAGGTIDVHAFARCGGGDPEYAFAGKVGDHLRLMPIVRYCRVDDHALEAADLDRQRRISPVYDECRNSRHRRWRGIAAGRGARVCRSGAIGQPADAKDCASAQSKT